jgi:uncharacterized integral membrane protein
MSTGNYPPAGQPESTGNYAGTNPTATGTSAREDATPAPDPGTPARTPARTPAPDPTPPTPGTATRPAANQPPVTRTGVVWAAVVAALVLLILLIIFILQNQEQVAVRYFALEGFVPLGMALFIASVAGGVLVAVAGGARILQLRRNAHRARSGQRK